MTQSGKTNSRHKKRLIRARMAATGESYMVAMRALEAQAGSNADFDGVVRSDEAPKLKVELTPKA